MAPLLSECAHPGCRALTMGGLCVRHEEPVTRVFPRGRPYVPLDVAGVAAVVLRAERTWARVPVPSGPPGEHAAAGFAGSPGR